MRRKVVTQKEQPAATVPGQIQAGLGGGRKDLLASLLLLLLRVRLLVEAVRFCATNATDLVPALDCFHENFLYVYVYVVWDFCWIYKSSFIYAHLLLVMAVSFLIC